MSDKCEHEFTGQPNWEGDPSVPGGTRHWVDIVCIHCGEYATEEEIDRFLKEEADAYEPDYDDDEPLEDPNYVYDPY